MGKSEGIIGKAVMVEGIFMDTSQLAYEVVLDDGFKFPRLLLTFNREEAENFIKSYNQPKEKP